MFLYREYDENFEHKLAEDFGLYPTVVHHEKIVEFRQEHLLETVQNHVVERFDQGDDDWLMNQVHVVLLWAENLDLKMCDV